jgi:hypothetical protein
VPHASALLTPLLAAAQAQNNYDVAAAKVSYVTADADADLVYTQTMAENDKNWKTTEADATQILEFALTGVAGVALLARVAGVTGVALRSCRLRVWHCSLARRCKAVLRFTVRLGVRVSSAEAPRDVSCGNRLHVRSTAARLAAASDVARRVPHG